MKNYFLIAAAFVAILLSSCNESPYINSPGDNSYNYPELPTWVPDTDGVVISVDAAYEIGMALKVDDKTSTWYKISGSITEMLTTETDITSGQYTSINFNMSDGGQYVIQSYRTNNINNKPYHDPSELPAVGSQVTVQGQLTKYQKNDGSFIIELTNSYLVRITPPGGN